MLIKPTNPMIKIIKGSINQQKIESRMKPFDLGGVGLGIVAALENSCEPVNKVAVLRRSRPIPVKISARDQTEVDGIVGDNDDDDEEYTIVTCRDPKESYTKVYTNKGNGRGAIRKRAAGVFHISPADSAGGGDVPTSDFLSSCGMCRKNLHGLDIYMYRGEKAFCSEECRYKQIVTDERKENYCSTEASRGAHAVDVPSRNSSPYAINGQNFTTGILASSYTVSARCC